MLSRKVFRRRLALSDKKYASYKQAVNTRSVSPLRLRHNGGPERFLSPPMRSLMAGASNWSRGRKASRAAGNAAHQVGVGHQPENREGARARGAADAPRPRRRGDRIGCYSLRRVRSRLAHRVILRLRGDPVAIGAIADIDGQVASVEPVAIDPNVVPGPASSAL